MTPRKSSGGDFQISTTKEPATIVAAGCLRLLVDSCEVYVADRRVELSPTECSLLRVLMEQHQRVATRTALMIAAWGAARVESIALLEDQIAALRSRLGHEVRIEAFPGIGYRLL
jgi:DNA-binding response OmpR family regulator